MYVCSGGVAKALNSRLRVFGFESYAAVSNIRHVFSLYKGLVHSAV